MQSVVEASESGDLAILRAGVECVCALLESTEELSKGSLMSETLIQYIDKTLSHSSLNVTALIKTNTLDMSQASKR